MQIINKMCLSLGMENIKHIEPKCLHLDIQEYGKVVRQYNDVSKSRFNKIAKEMIIDHLEKWSDQGSNEIKNVTIHFYTY